jgi:aspartate/methionine/tyrosine aminotransferase
MPVDYGDTKFIAGRMYRLGGEAAFELLNTARLLEKEGRKLVHLQIGEPDFDTPKKIREKAKWAIDNHDTHYTPSPGKLETREAVAKYYRDHRGYDVTWENVCITPGLKPAIFLSLLAVVEEGNEVIYPDPGYPTYASVVNFLGAKPVPMHLKEEKGFRFDVNELRALVTSKTRGIILNSPENPTGGVLTKEDNEAIAKLAIDHDLWVFTDEIYCRLVYDGMKYSSIRDIDGMAERVLLADGHSKIFAMTGWRLGYVVAPKHIAKALGMLMTNSASCAGSFIQTAGITALLEDQPEIPLMQKEFEARRNLIVDMLNDIPGVKCHKPAGAFYVFPNITSFGKKAKEIQDWLLFGAYDAGLKDQPVNGVALLAGNAFGPYGEGYLRLSYANSRENIEKALNFMKEAFKRLK